VVSGRDYRIFHNWPGRLGRFCILYKRASEVTVRREQFAKAAQEKRAARQALPSARGQPPEILFTGFGVDERAQLEALAITRGLHVVRNVTRNLTYLCSGPNAGPSKMAKAAEMGVEFVDQAWFRALPIQEVLVQKPDPIKQRIARMNRSKVAQVLTGICAGVVADGVLSDSEIAYLGVWLLENPEVAEMWPGETIARHLKEIGADRASDEKRQALFEFLVGLSGNEFAETGAAAEVSPFAEFDTDVEVSLSGHCICLTGEFSFGSRKECEEASQSAGAETKKDVSSVVDYLVVGSNCTTAWANTTYGRKIEKAMEYRKSYGKPRIVTEKQWLAAIKASADNDSRTSTKGNR